MPRERWIPVNRLRVLLAVAACGLKLRVLERRATIAHPGGLIALREGKIQPRLLHLIVQLTGVRESFLRRGGS